MAKELRQISESELREILKKHQEWLVSGGKEGERADLSDADLSGADLSYANLRGAKLIGANLREAKLIGANLREAKLSRAKLIGANLREAKLIGANLREAKLSEANLSGANLSGANLSGAHLSGAHLRETIFTDAIIDNTNFSKATLRRTKLQTARIISNRANPDWTDAVFEGTILDGFIFNTIPDDLKGKYKDTLVVSNVIVDEEGVKASFEFPEHLRTACEQYLQYFGEFLNDFGTSAEIAVRRKGQETLFSAIPENKETALEKVQEALAIYLSVPAASEADLNQLEVQTPEQQMAINRLQVQRSFLESQISLKNTELQAKNAELQAQQATIRATEKTIAVQEQFIDNMRHDFKMMLWYSLKVMEIQGKPQSQKKLQDMIEARIKIPWVQVTFRKSLEAKPKSKRTKQIESKA